MNRRDFLVNAAPGGAAALLLSVSGDRAVALGGADIIVDNFQGTEVTLPGGTRKLYPDANRWAFTFWPGTKWPDSYGDGTNWLAANAECQAYLSPFIGRVKGTPVPTDLRYDPFSIQSDGLHIKASLLSAAQQSAYQVGGYRRFGSGMLLSRAAFMFGNIRVAARLPSARGSWPGLWLLPESHQWPPEIDIFEAMPWAKHRQQIHFGVMVPKGATGHFSQWIDLDIDPSAGVHEYGLDWTPETLTGLLDGKVLWQQPASPSLQQNMYLIVNLAIGGKWPFNELSVLPIDSISPDRLSAGSELIQGDYPADMVIRSVKVTRLNG
jgi:Glycosyl hydrolases family 16